MFWNQEEPEKLWIGHRNKANEVLMADPSLFAPEARRAIHHPGGHNEGWPDALKNMMKKTSIHSFGKERACKPTKQHLRHLKTDTFRCALLMRF
ncbi:hypothetical protein GCM10020331_009240 [Ectobacillus funiculus]